MRKISTVKKLLNRGVYHECCYSIKVTYFWTIFIQISLKGLFNVYILFRNHKISIEFEPWGSHVLFLRIVNSNLRIKIDWSDAYLIRYKGHQSHGLIKDHDSRKYCTCNVLECFSAPHQKPKIMIVIIIKSCPSTTSVEV